MTGDDCNIECEARERGRYLERTSDLTEREAHTDSDGEPPSESVIKSDRSPFPPTSHASGGTYKNETELKPTYQNSRIRQQCYLVLRIAKHEAGRTVLPSTLCPPQWHKTGTNLCHVSTLRNVGFYTNPAPRGDQPRKCDQLRKPCVRGCGPRTPFHSNPLARGTDSDDHRTTGSVNQSDTPTGIKTSVSCSGFGVAFIPAVRAKHSVRSTIA